MDHTTRPTSQSFLFRTFQKTLKRPRNLGRGGLWLAIAVLWAIPTQANDIVDFLKKWSDAQRGYDQRQSQWDDRNRNRYQVRPDYTAPGIPFRPARDLTLSTDQCGLNPGHYDIDLYGGERLHLQVNPGVGGRRILPGGPDPLLLTREVETMRPHVEAVRRAVSGVSERDVRDAARDAERSLDRMLRDLRDNDITRARSDHDAFNVAWQRLLAGLSRYRIGPVTQSHLTAVEQHEFRLDALFRQQASSWAYDRPRLYGLSYVLTERTTALERAYVADRNDWRSKALARQIARVNFNADGFAESVRDNADFETLVEEYRIFDEAWHHLLDRIGQLGQYRPEIITVGRDIWNIDTAVADVLLIDPPMFSDRVVTAHVAERFATSCRRLERELEIAGFRDRDRTTSLWGLSQHCGSLSRAATALERCLTDDRRIRDCRGEFRDVASAWQLVQQNTLAIRNRPGFANLLATLATDYHRLEQALDNDFDWRFADRVRR